MDDLEHLLSKFKRLTLRARILQAIRDFFQQRQFLEVTTPIISHDLLPEEHIDLILSEAGYLLPSPEIHMKQLLAAGYKRIFQIGPCFRKGEKGKEHLPEFTLLEWYRTGEDYHALAEDCEQLLLWIADNVFNNGALFRQGRSIDLTRPWPRLTVQKAFLDFAGWDPMTTTDAERFELDFAETIIPRLDPCRPVFLLDFPDYAASLAKKKTEDPRRAERLELFAGGLELANGFSELVDPLEQRTRFEQANQRRTVLGKKPYPLPEKFLACLDRMPPSAGIALGVDRLVMLFTGVSDIEEVVAIGLQE